MNEKLLFVSAYNASFVKADIEILKNHFSVTSLLFLNKKRNILSLIKMTFVLFSNIRKNDIVFCWFADFTAFLTVKIANLLGKKSYVVVGGYEVAKLPEINYGGLLQNSGLGRLRYILLRSSQVFAVSKSSENEILKFESQANPHLIYNGVKVNKFHLEAKNKKHIITVGIISKSNLMRKGLKNFVLVAKMLPEYNFTLIGKDLDGSLKELKEHASPNIKFTGFVSDEMLLKKLQEAKVYVQLSAHEAFGVSVAEAMLCGCIPVVTCRGALPEVVGEFGYVVQYDDLIKTAEAIKIAANSKVDGKVLRNWIINNFSLKIREKKLIEEINNEDST